MATMIFERQEKKYLLTDTQKEQFLKRIAPYTEPDAYGAYTLSNLYFDNDWFGSIRRSIEKPVFKEKMRLRAYGTPGEEDRIYWELKKKYKKTGYKRRLVTTPPAMEAYLQEGVPLPDSQTFRELDYVLRSQQLYPRLYLAYDREAYYAKEDRNIRFTFDRNIRWRWEDLDLTHGDHDCKVYPLPGNLLELKVYYRMPLWLVEILTDLEIYPVSFSKYGKIFEMEGIIYAR